LHQAVNMSLLPMLLLSLLSVGCCQEENPIDNVHLVDSITLPSGRQNFLFRGSEPIEDYTNGSSFFAEDDLLKALRNASKEAGVQLPSVFRLVDVTLIHNDPVTDAEDFTNLAIEVAFFQRKGPKFGEIVYWETMGNDANASTVPAPMRNFLARTLAEWQGDRIGVRVEVKNPLAQHGLSSPPDLARRRCVRCSRQILESLPSCTCTAKAARTALAN
jgi:hypothetical protein